MSISARKLLSATRNSDLHTLGVTPSLFPVLEKKSSVSKLLPENVKSEPHRAEGINAELNPTSGGCFRTPQGTWLMEMWIYQPDADV